MAVRVLDCEGAGSISNVVAGACHAGRSYISQHVGAPDVSHYQTDWPDCSQRHSLGVHILGVLQHSTAHVGWAV